MSIVTVPAESLVNVGPHAFDIVAPPLWSKPAVVNSPHSGRIIPATLLQQAKLSEHELRRSEDSFVDELFSGCVGLGVPMLRALVSRAYIDLNREPHELDQRMFADKLPSYANTATPRVLSGIGTIPRVVADGTDIYQCKLSAADAIQRIETVYRPYHCALQTLLNQAHKKVGFVLLLDCHSMPTSAVSDLTHRNSQADVVIGDRFGTSADPEIVETLEGFFANQGLRVRRNRPYAGGFITETHGKPKHQRHAIQIEINRGLYMDEGKLAKRPEFEKLQQKLTVVMSQFYSALDQAGWFADRTLAAE